MVVTQDLLAKLAAVQLQIRESEISALELAVEVSLSGSVAFADRPIRFHVLEVDDAAASQEERDVVAVVADPLNSGDGLHVAVDVSDLVGARIAHISEPFIGGRVIPPPRTHSSAKFSARLKSSAPQCPSAGETRARSMVSGLRGTGSDQ